MYSSSLESASVCEIAKMPRIQRTALVPYSADEMFKVVTDVPHYNEFLPWCSGARILQREGD